MGRRALPKIDPGVDLSRHWFRLAELPPTWRMEEAFPASGSALSAQTANGSAGNETTRPEIEIEVGSGKGLFLSAAAQANPGRNFLGIEISDRYARFAAYRLARAEIANAAMVSGDALRFIREFVPAESAAAVHVYFPDPWWKARHRKRRVMNEAFLADVVRVLRPEGELHFWTDVAEYFETALALIATLPQLAGPRPVPEQPAMHDLDYRTHFERRMRRHGHPIYRSLFVKRANVLSIDGARIH